MNERFPITILIIIEWIVLVLLIKTQIQVSWGVVFLPIILLAGLSLIYIVVLIMVFFIVLFFGWDASYSDGRWGAK